MGGKKRAQRPYACIDNIQKLSFHLLFRLSDSSSMPPSPPSPILPSLLTPPRAGVCKRGHMFRAKKKCAQITPMHITKTKMFGK